MYPSFPSFTSILVFIKYLTLLWAELTLLMDQHEIQIGCDILFFVWTNQSGCGRCHSREERKYVFISFFFFVVGFLSFFDDLKECHTNTHLIWIDSRSAGWGFFTIHGGEQLKYIFFERVKSHQGNPIVIQQCNESSYEQCNACVLRFPYWIQQ